MANARRDHYLPAGLIGGFGVPHPSSDRRRHAKVCTRTRPPEDVLTPEIKAERVAYGVHVYDVDEPSDDLPADYAEKIWELYERDLPDAAKALEEPAFDPENWLVVLRHIQASWVRNPGFERDAINALVADGIAVPSNDQIQGLRKAAHAAMPQEVLARARFAVIRRSEMARRFIVDDRGFVPLLDTVTGRSGVLFPLTGNVAVMMVWDVATPGEDYQAGPFAQLVLTSTGAEALHTATWSHKGIELVIGHPEDAGWIAELSDPPDHGAPLPGYGPYRGTSETVFGWASRPAR
jgi:hypothetical protein